MRFVLTFLAALLLISPAIATDFPVCKGGHRVTCVVDGDTFWLKGEKIRPEGFDAPEMGKPKCSGPAAGAVEARSALAQLLGSGAIEVTPTGRSYDRTLARVTVDGRDIARTMIEAGHGRRYRPGQQPWC